MKSLSKFAADGLESVSSFAMFIVIIAGVGIGLKSGGFAGLLIGLAAGLLASVLSFGLLFVFIEMNKNLRAIREKIEKLETVTKD